MRLKSLISYFRISGAILWAIYRQKKSWLVCILTASPWPLFIVLYSDFKCSSLIAELLLDREHHNSSFREIEMLLWCAFGINIRADQINQQSITILCSDGYWCGNFPNSDSNKRWIIFWIEVTPQSQNIDPLPLHTVLNRSLRHLVRTHLYIHPTVTCFARYRPG